MHRHLLLLAALLPVAVVACDKKDEPAKSDEKPAEAEKQPEKQPEDKPPAPDPAAELAAKIEALAVIPAELPEDIETACDQMTAQLDQINQAKLSGDDLTKWQTGGKEGVLAPARAMCVKRGDIVEAACAAAAMETGGVEIEPHIGEIMQACAKKAAAVKQ